MCEYPIPNSYLALTSKTNVFDIMSAHANKCRNFFEL